MVGPWTVRTRKPHGSVRVNFAHPLAKNIAFFYYETQGVASGDATFYDAVTGKKHATSTGQTANASSDTLGGGRTNLFFNGSAKSTGTAFTNPRSVDTTQTTVFARFKVTAKPASLAILAAYQQTGGARGAYVGVDGSGFVGGGATSSNGFGLAKDAVDHTNQWVNAAGSGDGTSSAIVRGWVNGVRQTDTTVGGNTTGATVGNVYLGHDGTGYNQNFTGEIGLVIGWNCLLTDAEHARLSANPWQILMPQQSVTFFSLPGAAGTVLTIDYPFAAEFGKGIQGSITGPIEFGNLELSNISAPVEFGASLAAISQGLIEISAAIRGDQVAPVEWIGGLVAQISAFLEYGGTLSADRTFPVEFGQSLRGDQVAPAEFGQSIRSDQSAPLEFGQAIRADRTAPVEFGSGQAIQITVPIEYGGSGASLTIDIGACIEWGSTLGRDINAPIEVGATVVATATLLETIGAALQADGGMPVETGQRIQADINAAIERLAGIVATQGAPIQFAAGLASDCLVQIEFTGNAIVVTLFDPKGVIIGKDRRTAILATDRKTVIIGN